MWISPEWASLDRSLSLDLDRLLLLWLCPDVLLATDDDDIFRFVCLSRVVAAGSVGASIKRQSGAAVTTSVAWWHSDRLADSCSEAWMLSAIWRAGTAGGAKSSAIRSSS
jgi:hypothetical protein